MSIDGIKSTIERINRDIERQKAKIADCREDIAKTRVRKSRESERYTRRLKAASSTASRHNIRSQKKRDWESFARDIDRQKSKIETCRSRIKGYRDDIKRNRERIKRLR